MSDLVPNTGDCNVDYTVLDDLDLSGKNNRKMSINWSDFSVLSIEFPKKCIDGTLGIPLGCR